MNLIDMQWALRRVASKRWLVSVAGLAAALTGMAAPDAPLRRTEILSQDWRFAKGAQTNAQEAGFNDGAWQPVTVPHDWAITGAV